jgi:23S rRNA pseudouridine1911/1915/1917 synthase
MDDEGPKLAIKGNAAVVVRVLFEDHDLLVVEKPAGVVTQPGKGHASDSLLNGLFATHGKWLHNLGAGRDFGLLHRLDKDTSGLLVVALKPAAYDQLRRDFEARKVEKIYLALTDGVPAPKQGVIQARLKEITIPGANRFATVKKSIVSRQGDEAVTVYRTVAAKDSRALIELNIKTGRLHQIRVHLQFVNAPVLGDGMYAAATKAKGRDGLPPRLCLHAHRLGFKHPMTQKWLETTSPLPADLRAYARRLGLVRDCDGAAV